MSEQQDKPSRPPKGRSPSYPAISLNDAIGRARVIWDHAKQHPLPIATITQRWGYKSATTGPASTNYAALKKYGLLEDEGSGKDRRGHLTELAIEILNKPDPSDAIMRAAMTPPIMREFWERFGRDVPPVDALNWEFVIERGFTEGGLADFVRVYNATAAELPLDPAARIGSEDTEESESYDDSPNSDDASRSPVRPRSVPAPRRPSVLTIPVPIVGSDPVIVEFPGKIPESDWDQFIAVLTAMKPGLIAAPDTDD